MSEVSLVAALDRNFAIGRGGAMPWHLPADLKRFKALTLGKTMLMGRKTALAIRRDLPGRINLVMTRGDTAPYAGQRVVHSLGDTHLYVNHLDQAREQLSREPRELPKLVLNPDVRSLEAFRYDDIAITDYQPHAAIRAPVAV